MDHIRKDPFSLLKKTIIKHRNKQAKTHQQTKNLNQIPSVQLHSMFQTIRNNNITYLLVYTSLAVLINSGLRQYLFLSS